MYILDTFKENAEEILIDSQNGNLKDDWATDLNEYIENEFW